jgi:hypothetical protein
MSFLTEQLLQCALILYILEPFLGMIVFIGNKVMDVLEKRQKKRELKK